MRHHSEVLLAGAVGLVFGFILAVKGLAGSFADDCQKAQRLRIGDKVFECKEIKQ